jgi:hypothetical protein
MPGLIFKLSGYCLHGRGKVRSDRNQYLVGSQPRAQQAEQNEHA